jgi:histidinol-phosphatase (PHP family)
MCPLTNYHTHTHFCDGSAAPEEYVKAAIDEGFSDLGFSAHAPLPFDNKWSVRPDMLEKYTAEVRRLQKVYASKIRIHLGLEADYIAGITGSFDKVRAQCGFDYIIGAVHLVKSDRSDHLWFIDGDPSGYDEGLRDIYQMDIKAGVDAYFKQLWEMISSERFDILAHADKIKMNNRGLYFSTDERWYQEYIEQTISLIAARQFIVEVNTRGIYKKRSPEFYPSIPMLEKLFAGSVKVTISTDAHQPGELSLQWKEAADCLKSIGYRHIMGFDGKGWTERPL